MIDNYPPGSNTPDAPWNRPDNIYSEWEFNHVTYCKICDNCTDVNEDDICEKCFEPQIIEEENE